MDYIFDKIAEPPVTATEASVVGQSAYWDRVDELAGEVVRIIDEQEDWVIEGHTAFQSTLDELLSLVRTHPRISDYIQEHPESALKLMAYLHTSTAMMLMHVNAGARPAFIRSFIDAVQGVIQKHADDAIGVAANLAVERFTAFERTGLIARIFSKERVEGVLDAIERAGARADARRS